MTMDKKTDDLEVMWTQQEEFMRVLQQKRNFPEFPVDITSKLGQKFLKGIAQDCMHELFEAIQHLKNSKDHRATEITTINREAFLEEMVDALHFFFEVVIAAGVSREELIEAYITKGEINVERINDGY